MAELVCKCLSTKDLEQASKLKTSEVPLTWLQGGVRPFLPLQSPSFLSNQSCCFSNFTCQICQWLWWDSWWFPAPPYSFTDILVASVSHLLPLQLQGTLAVLGLLNTTQQKLWHERCAKLLEHTPRIEIFESLLGECSYKVSSTTHQSFWEHCNWRMQSVHLIVRESSHMPLLPPTKGKSKCTDMSCSCHARASSQPVFVRCEGSRCGEGKKHNKLELQEPSSEKCWRIEFSPTFSFEIQSTIAIV